MAHYYSLSVAALAAALTLCAGSLQVSAADAQNPETVEETQSETEAVTVSDTTEPSQTTAAEETENAGGWMSENGRFYYILPDGTKAVGEMEIDGVPYLFGFSGALKIDWQTVNDNRYFYDPTTGKALFGWVSYFNNTYYVTPECGKLTGFQEIDGVQYAFSEDGALRSGAFYADEILYCAADDGVLEEGLIQTETDAFLTDENGAVVTGWYVSEDGKTYYGDPSTYHAALGLTVIDGSCYYITPEEGLLKGTQIIDGQYYPLDDETGALRTGWFTLDDVQHYFDPESMTMLKDTLCDIDGRMYYFDAVGDLATGWQSVNGENYWFNVDGSMYTSGVLELEDGTYLFDDDGKLCYGWQEIAGQQFYFTENGTMAVSDTLEIGDYAYTFDEFGVVIDSERINYVLDVVSYKQTDEEWGSVRLGTTASSSIAKSGCLVTSMAMLESYRNGTECKPTDMKDMLKFTSDGSLTNWNLISDLGYTVETYNCSVTEDILMQIYVRIQAGCPVVLGSKGSSGQHYVLVTGYIGDGTSFTASNFTINDPGYSDRFYLSDHLARFSRLYKLIY